MRKKGRKRHMRLKHCNEGWIEEVENKINSRDVEILNAEGKVEMTTKNKMIMDLLVGIK